MDSVHEKTQGNSSIDSVRAVNLDAPPLPSEDVLWECVLRRDRTSDGVFVYAVSTTGIYCRPSCPSRRPRRANVRFFPDAQTAEREGFRACRRCQPEAERDGQSEAIYRVRAYIETHLDEDLSLTALSQIAFLTPTHLHRTFKRIVGVTPRQYVEAQRRERFKLRLRKGGTVTKALYDAGYRSSSGLYTQVSADLGMTPSVYQRGGQGMKIDYTIVVCSLGRLLVAATDRGLCAVYFGETEAELVAALEHEYPAATRVACSDGLGEYIASILDALDTRETSSPPAKLTDLPLDITGTPFQRQVWRALQMIPSGQTRSYAEIAKVIGHPAATRAVAQACSSNSVAIVIPCHRVRRTNGTLGGYRWGVERKRALLMREGALSDGKADA
ncbi:MAG TPA: bifunctional DNA-binding transcriptional regulator/O6-methylguanine-DNA methyltransferase Ada [Ktedonobacterales bacterium]